MASTPFKYSPSAREVFPLNMEDCLVEPWLQPDGNNLGEMMLEPPSYDKVPPSENFMPGQYPLEAEMKELPSCAPTELMGGSIQPRGVAQGINTAAATKRDASSAQKPLKPRKTPSRKSSVKDVVIAVFGLTGTGKSTFINKVTGSHVKIGDRLKSCESKSRKQTRS